MEGNRTLYALELIPQEGHTFQLALSSDAGEQARLKDATVTHTGQDGVAGQDLRIGAGDAADSDQREAARKLVLYSAVPVRCAVRRWRLCRPPIPCC